MAVLSAIFNGIDNISSVFDTMASSGERAVSQWESAGNNASNVLGQIASEAENAVSSMQTTSSAMDTWTSAVGNYDKSALEAVYTTQELVELGYKTEEALIAENQAAENTAKTLGKVASSAELTSKEFSELEKESSKAEDSTVSAVTQLEQVIAAAGIAKMVNDIKNAVVDLTNEFVRAESIIVKATGATGEGLDGLSNSMMNVSSTTAKDLEIVASSIGELNTRLKLQGEELENSSKLFLRYATITNSDVVGSIQNVTKIMKNWDVDVENMEGLLDKLSLAGQNSGISVDQLSNMLVTNKATLQQLNYGLDESIGLLAMFEAEGLNSTQIMVGFNKAVNFFSKEGKDTSTAMKEMIEQIRNTRTESEATSLAASVFGKKAGPELARAIQHGQFQIEDWVAAISNADGTLSKTANAASTLEGKWGKASNNISTAFTRQLSPATESVSKFFAKMVDGAGDMLNKYPALTATITGLGVALGVIATAFAAYTAATTLATIATTVLGGVSFAALWPLYLVAAAIGAVVAISIGLSNWLGESNKEFNSLTATSKEHYTAMQDLNAEYERTVELEGENSAAARELAVELESARAVYEANKLTLEEFIATTDELLESHKKIVSDYNDGISSINNEEKSAMALITKLGELSLKTKLTASEQMQMSAIVDKLNNQMPELALSYDKVAGKLNRSTQALEEMAKAQAEQQRQEVQMKSYVDALGEQEKLTSQIAVAEANLNAERERHGMYLDEFSGQWMNDFITEDSLWASWTTDLGTYKDALEELKVAQGEANQIIAETKSAWEKQSAAQEEAARASKTYEEAVGIAAQSVVTDLQKLAEEYDNAYNAARDSIDNQIGLFDKMKTETKLSISEMEAAMKSQSEYLETYNKNLQKASKLGLDEGLISKLSDGSAESAGQLDAIINKAEKLGETTKTAKDFIESFNSQFQKVEKAKDTFATQVATMQTDFDTNMTKIETRMTTAISNMNMEKDAAASAQKTIAAYVAAIRSGVSKAESAASAVANAVNKKLGKKGINITGLTEDVDNEYAVGTMSAAPGLALVGENGPELVNFGGGEVVYTAPETERIITAAGNISTNINPPENMNFSDKQTRGTSSSEKKITLEISGKGSVEVGNSDKNSVLEVMIENMKPVLLNIISQDVFEEGDGAYEF